VSDDISIPRPGPLPARTSFTHSYRARRTGMDDGTKRLLVVAGVLGLTLVGGMGAWSLMGRHSGAIPVIEADSRPIRVKPDNPGGMQVIGANEQIMGDGAAGEVDKMGPGAESPDPQALRAQTMPRTASTQAPEPQTASAPPAAEPPAPATPRTAEASVSPLPDTLAPAARAVSRPPPAAHPATGGTMVQVAALDSEAAAKAEWQRLAKRMPDVLGGREPVVQRADRDGKSVWRVRLGGFADTAEATAFCARIRGKGGACSLASF